jgi:hypothetical protein
MIVEYVGQDGFDHQEEYYESIIDFLEERGAQYVRVVDDEGEIVYEYGNWVCCSFLRDPSKRVRGT